jgi:TonB-dependent starch-binding outer membrane protein SusC
MNRHFTKSTLILLIGMLGCFTSFAQSKTIKGVIKSADTQEPLQGVTIGIKGEPVGGTFTNSRGEFSLVVPSNKAVLKVSSGR